MLGYGRREQAKSKRTLSRSLSSSAVHYGNAWYHGAVGYDVRCSPLLKLLSAR
jgi:hypothetical protein